MLQKKSGFETFSESNFQALCDLLADRDPDLAIVLTNHGYPPMWTRPNTFETLVHIILEQQVSLASALATLSKLREKITVVSPENVLLLSDTELRACYFSRQKMVYVRSLASAIVQKQISLDELAQLPGDMIREKLIKLKGIGRWTIDVYLMFVLRHADIFPAGDLAAVKALRAIKQRKPERTTEQYIALTDVWRPYRTIATMILWHHYLSSRANAFP